MRASGASAAGSPMPFEQRAHARRRRGAALVGQDRRERRRVDRPALVRLAQQRLDARRALARAPPPFDRRRRRRAASSAATTKPVVAERLVRQRFERDAPAPVVPRRSTGHGHEPRRHRALGQPAGHLTPAPPRRVGVARRRAPARGARPARRAARRRRARAAAQQRRDAVARLRAAPRRRERRPRAGQQSVDERTVLRLAHRQHDVVVAAHGDALLAHGERTRVPFSTR